MAGAGKEKEQNPLIKFEEVHPLLERKKGHTCEGGLEETGIVVTTLREAMDIHNEGVLRIKIPGGVWDFYWGQERRFSLRHFMMRLYQKMMVRETLEGKEDYGWLTYERALIPWPNQSSWDVKQSPDSAWFKFIKPLEAYQCRKMLPFLTNPFLIEGSEVMIPVTGSLDQVGARRTIQGRFTSWEIPMSIPRDHFAIFCRDNKLILERHRLDNRSERARLEGKQFLSSERLSEIPLPPPPANF